MSDNGRICERCDGTGVGWPHASCACWACGGDGWVWASDPQEDAPEDYCAEEGGVPVGS